MSSKTYSAIGISYQISLLVADLIGGSQSPAVHHQCRTVKGARPVDTKIMGGSQT